MVDFASFSHNVHWIFNGFCENVRGNRERKAETELGPFTSCLMCCSHQCPTSRGGLSEAITMHPDGPKIGSMAAQRAPNDPQRTSKRVDRLDNPAGFNTVEHVHSITQQAPIPLCCVVCVCWVSDIVSGEDVMMNR